MIVFRPPPPVTPVQDQTGTHDALGLAFKTGPEHYFRGHRDPGECSRFRGCAKKEGRLRLLEWTEHSWDTLKTVSFPTVHTIVFFPMFHSCVTNSFSRRQPILWIPSGIILLFNWIIKKLKIKKQKKAKENSGSEGVKNYAASLNDIRPAQLPYSVRHSDMDLRVYVGLCMWAMTFHTACSDKIWWTVRGEMSQPGCESLKVEFFLYSVRTSVKISTWNFSDTLRRVKTDEVVSSLGGHEIFTDNGIHLFSLELFSHFFYCLCV